MAGLLSGTSADAIDCAICSIEGGGPARDVITGAPRTPARVKLEAFRSHPWDPALRELLLHSADWTVRDVAACHAAVGDAFAEALLRTLVLSGIPEEAVDLVGSHGQTVYHHCGTTPKVTLQIGDPDRIAEKTGFAVIGDFRARDVAGGGEGAPLTPYADTVLFPVPEGSRRAVLNLGGIGNITILDADPRRVVAFDTGPANAPLDRLAGILSGGSERFDGEGRIAASGKVLETLLAQCLQHPFLRKAPPKSTGTEEFGAAFVDALVKKHGASADLMATLAEFVAQCVVVSLRVARVPEVDEVVVAGGGSRNLEVMRRLRAALAPAPVIPSDERGVPAAAREAMAFAILANDALLGLPTSLPRVTGAAHPATLGKLSFPSLRG